MPSPEASRYAAPVWVLAESLSDHVAKVTLELLGDAKKLAASREAAAEVVLLCNSKQSGRFLEELRPYEPARVQLLEHEALGSYTTSTYLQCLEALLVEGSPSSFLIPATVNGRDLAPRLAARAGMGYFPHCLTIKPVASDRLEITRVTHGGRVHVQSVWDSGCPVLATMKSGVADAPAPNPRAGEVPVTRHHPALRSKDLQVRVLEYIPPDPRVQDIREAERIVAGGRGVGGAERFAVIRDLADALGAAVAASRVAVDLGWMPYERQVGQTGKTVAPQLYFAVGISGASHHLMGMRGSEKIVAVNTDKKAPIFSVAHFGVVGDLHKILPLLARRIRAGRQPDREQPRPS